MNIAEAAAAKLKRIIEREGDDNGNRNKPEYLYQLIAEEAAFRKTVAEIKKGRQSLHPNDHNQPMQV